MILESKNRFSSYPIKFLILELIIDIKLSSIKEIILFCLKINNIIKVIPDIMLIGNMLIIIFLFALNLISCVSTHKAEIIKLFVSVLLLISKVSKIINDNTKNDIQPNNIHNNKK